MTSTHAPQKPLPNSPPSKEWGKGDGHWITVIGHNGGYYHVWVKGPRRGKKIGTPDHEMARVRKFDRGEVARNPVRTGEQRAVAGAAVVAGARPSVPTAQSIKEQAAAHRQSKGDRLRRLSDIEDRAYQYSRKRSDAHFAAINRYGSETVAAVRGTTLQAKHRAANRYEDLTAIRRKESAKVQKPVEQAPPARPQTQPQAAAPSPPLKKGMTPVQRVMAASNIQQTRALERGDDARFHKLRDRYEELVKRTNTYDGPWNYPRNRDKAIAEDVGLFMPMTVKNRVAARRAARSSRPPEPAPVPAATANRPPAAERAERAYNRLHDAAKREGVSYDELGKRAARVARAVPAEAVRDVGAKVAASGARNKRQLGEAMGRNLKDYKQGLLRINF